ncbi:MAG: hypothetical protein OEY51_01970 [Cyclobacteriaceae bacterium]|nr:hypothetical protein [Cyclobacteriaceae bacterium]
MKRFYPTQTLKSFFHDSKWTIFTVSLRSLGTITVFKLIALYFGASGVAVFSHFQNLIAIFTQVPDQGTNLGVIKLYNFRNNPRYRARLYATAMVINITLFILIAALFLLDSSIFLRQFQEYTFTGPWIFSLLLSVAFILINTLSLSLLYARQAFKLLFSLTILNVLILIVSISLGVMAKDLGLAMIAFAMGHGLAGIGNIFILVLNKIIPLRGLKFDKSISKKLWQFMLMALGGYFFGKLTDFFVRDFALNWFGTEETGYWQAQVRLSDSYRSVFLGTVGVVFYTGISKLVQDAAALKKYTREIMQTMIPLVVIGLSLMWFLRDWIIMILFSHDLLKAGDFLLFQLVADLFALPSFLLVFILAVRQKTSTFLITHFLSAIFYLALVVGITGFSNMGIAGIPMANAVRYVFFFSILVLYSRKDLF